MKTLRPLLGLVLTLNGLAALHAQVPQLINYQGRIVVQGTNYDGSGRFKFALVSNSGSVSFWSNDGTSTAAGEPGSAVSLTVSKGLYAVLLGDTNLANMTAIPASVFTNEDVWLGIWFSDGSHGFQRLTPDQRVVPVGYAMMAAAVPDGAITSAKIAAGAVGTAQLADRAVTAAQLAPGAVGTSQLASNAITAGHLAAGAIEAASTNAWILAFATDPQYLTNTTRAAMSRYLLTLPNLRMVLGAGDEVDFAAEAAQWANSTNFWYPLKAAGIPHLLAVGNHDYDGFAVNAEPLALTEFANYYGSQYYAGQSWFNGGHYETNAANSWITQRIAGRDWLFLTLEWGPRDAVVEWARGVFTNHPNHRIIVAMHNYLRPEGTRDGEIARGGVYLYGVHDYGMVSGRNDAQQLWTKLFKGTPNLCLVLSGHYGFRIDGLGGEYAGYEREHSPGRALAWGDTDNPVWQIMANYQGYATDSDQLTNGWMRLMTFDGDLVRVETFSPSYGTNRAGRLHDFTLDLSVAPNRIKGKSVIGLTQYSSEAALSAHDLAEGLWFYAPLNELWSTNVLDVAGGNIGVFGTRAGHSGTAAFTTNGVSGGGLGFGDWSFVNFGNAQEPWLNALSASVWYQGSRGSACGGTFVSRHNGGTDSEFSFFLSDTLNVTVTSVTGSSVTRTFPLPITPEQIGTDLAWHHYGFVYDGTNLAAYFDGQSLGAQAGPSGGPWLNTSSRNLYIGDYQGGGGGSEYTLSGTIDEVKLWSRPLSPQDMFRLATEGGPQLGLQSVSATQTCAASGTVYANARTVRVAGSGSAVTLTSTPTIPDGVDGQVVEVWGTSDTDTVTFQDQDTLPSSNLELSAATRTLGMGDCLRLCFSRTAGVWYEMGFADN